MGYPRHIFQRAQQELAERRQRAFEQADRRKNEVYSVIPEIKEIEKNLRAAGTGVIKAAFSEGVDLEAAVKAGKEESLKLQKQRIELLEKSGFSCDYMNVKFSCPECEDRGYVNNRRCSCFTQILKQLTYKELGSGWDIQQYTMSCFDLSYYSNEPDGASQVIPRVRMKEIYDYCAEYINSFCESSESLLFMGSTGLGKTHLSLAIAEQVINRGYGVLYTSAQTMVSRLEKEKFQRSFDDDAEEPYRERIVDCDLLIIDDLGAEFLTQFAVSAINDIIDRRLVFGKPTIVTTNLERSGIQERYGERLLSRVYGSYKAFRFFGKDIRVAKRLR
ncbi:MAG: ATP-binding protein [Oscillospiraceae bacterium]|nr:ATP-binding protein [Oscillospiraceae bacterium]